MTLQEAKESIRSDESYYDRNTTVGMLPSNSSIGKLLGEDPKDFLKPFPRHINLTLGSYYHDLVTRPDIAETYVIIPDDMHRGSNEYKKLAGNEVLMKESEAAGMRVLANKTLADPFIQMILKDPTTLIEEPYIVKKYDVWWKMKQDIVVPGLKLRVDLKTSNADDFGDSCYHWGYHSQCAMYLAADTPDEDSTFLFYVANKQSQETQIYEPSKEMLEAGENRICEAAAVYQKWESYFKRKMI